MNNAIQFVARGAIATSGTALTVPLTVPDKMAFRLRHVEFRMRDLPQAIDTRFNVGLSKLANDNIFATDLELMNYAHFLAYVSWGWEITGTAGLGGLLSMLRVPLWDYDYRLVMRPTVIGHAVGTTHTIAVAVVGELVRVSEGERNSIIAWQGGAKDA